MWPKSEATLVCCGFLALAFLAVAPVPAKGINTYDIIVVRGDLPTDYTIASIYAGAKRIPLVLLDPDRIKEEIGNELVGYRGRGYRMLLIIGGESAISGTVENELKSMGFTVNRLWDWNRYGTAARVSMDLWGKSDKVVITNGEDYSGFLIAQKAALDIGAPILFIKNSTVPVETSDALRELGAKSVILISGDKGASDALKSLGVAVEAIETTKPENPGSTASRNFDLQFYIILSLLLVILVLLSLRFAKKGKSPTLILTEDEERVAGILKMHGKMEQSRLAKLTDFSKPRVSRMLRSMEERGIIEREKFKKTYMIRLKHNI